MANLVRKPQIWRTGNLGCWRLAQKRKIALVNLNPSLIKVSLEVNNNQTVRSVERGMNELRELTQEMLRRFD